MGEAVAACQPGGGVCGGYMRVLGDDSTARFRGRPLTIPRPLLPKYRGLHTHTRALEAGDERHGGSVHFVIPELDAGSVIAQASTPVLPEDTAQTMAHRLLPQE